MANRASIILNKNRILNLLSQGRRIDGRGLRDYRSISIDIGVAGKANGSASVRIGDTYVMVGVKAEIGTPFPDTPDEGVLMVNAEFVPLASPSFEPGPPDENAIELARVVDRGLRKSEAFNFRELCIIPGKKVWMIWVDIYVLDYNGNLTDAAALAALASLMNAKLPVPKVEGEEVVLTDKTVPLKLNDYPIAVTIGKLGESLIIDPVLEEEEVLDGRITFFITKDGNICAIQKSLPGFFSPDEVLVAVDLAREKAVELREKLFKIFGLS